MIQINGNPSNEIDVFGIKPGTVISIGSESIRIISKEQAIELMGAIIVIAENFDAD